MSATARVARYRIRHRTVYSYGGEVAHSHQLLHLLPRAVAHQSCLAHALEIAPIPASRRDSVDAFGNPVTRLEIDRPHDRLDVTASMDVEIRDRGTCAAADTLPWEEVRAALRYAPQPLTHDALEAHRFRCESPHVRIKRTLADYASECFTPGRPLLAAAVELMHKIHAEFTYAPGETDITTPLMEVHATRRGVCQDYAHFMISCLRSLGLSARYVSGYLRTTVAPAPPKGAGQKPEIKGAAAKPDAAAASPASVKPAVAGEAAAKPAAPAPESKSAERQLIGADASHAWVAVYAPPCGWVELDPTNDLMVGLDHVALAWGRDFGDVSPLRGVILGGGKHVLAVTVEVKPM